MASMIRFRKLWYVALVKLSSQSLEPQKIEKKDEALISKVEEKPQRKRPRRQPKEWRCLDCCCWAIGYICTIWWLLVLLYSCLPSSVFQAPEPPGARLKREGLTAVHPVILVPGIVTGGLELWEGKPCSEGLFRKRLWGGSFTEIIKRPLCWLEHLSLHNETGLDPEGIRVRAVPGLVAADYFAPGYFVWAILIENLAKIGYEGKNMYMAAYDWRLSFQNTETRDQSLSRLKSKIELLYQTNGYKKVVVVPHSMGVIYFLHFMKWVEAPPPIGGGGGPGWCAKHIKSVMNIGPAFLGVPKVVSNLFSAEGKDVAYVRAMDPGVLDSQILGLQTLEHIMRVSRTWDSLISLIPKGGETIWGNMDWAPEQGYQCDSRNRVRLKTSVTENDTKKLGGGLEEFHILDDSAKYGRMISFGKDASRTVLAPLSAHRTKEAGDKNSSSTSRRACGEIWTEYDEMSWDSIREIADNKAYTANTILDLLRFVAPKMMQRAESHFSHGVADDLDDPRYSHYKYWSNPLETKLPDAPEMEIHCLYGVGLPTERSYVYKTSPSNRCKSIPFRIDMSADKSPDGCLKSGIYLADGDESVPVISAGFMCAKGWRGKTRFNPSGSPTFVREYRHKPPGSLLEGRGAESGSHVDIMGNVALIEDVLRVAAGATGAEMGGDRIYSDILAMSERINLKL
uniref:phospholipid:diacylglycerol acyltransferase n=1 Tax=Kalanchoe fedtschenkoi TaxID=63787 RepID=A0A7N0VA29_KALFE